MSAQKKHNNIKNGKNYKKLDADSISGSKRADEAIRAYREDSSPLGSYSGVTSAMGGPKRSASPTRGIPRHVPYNNDPIGGLGPQDMMDFPGRSYLPGTGIPDVPFFGEGTVYVAEDELPVQDADDL